MRNLSKDCKIFNAMTVTDGAAGTSDITGLAVDCGDFEQCLFIVVMGAITAGAVTSIKVQQSSDDGGSDAYADLAGTSQTIADTDDNKTFYVEVVKPRERYLKLIVDRGTQNAVVQSVTAILSGSRKAPVTHGTGVSGETHISPAEGTA